jgi:hypothetical protein
MVIGDSSLPLLYPIDQGGKNAGGYVDHILVAFRCKGVRRKPSPKNEQSRPTGWREVGIVAHHANQDQISAGQG